MVGTKDKDFFFCLRNLSSCTCLTVPSPSLKKEKNVTWKGFEHGTFGLEYQALNDHGHWALAIVKKLTIFNKKLDIFVTRVPGP